MGVDPISAASIVAKYSLVYLYKYIQKRRIERLNDNLKRDDVIIVLEVGREITPDVEAQLGTVDFKISAVKEITMEEMPRLAAQAALAIKTANTMTRGRRIVLVLSGPVVMNFLLGQYIGLSHYNIVLAYWNRGKYELMPQAHRNLLKP